MKKKTIYVITWISIMICFSCSRAYKETFYSFDGIPDRIWVGDDFWTVPLEGWRLRNGRIECVSHLRNATLSNLTHVLEEGNAPFIVRVDMGLLEKGDQPGSSGVIIGSEATEEKDVRAAVYFGQGINIGVNTAGFAFLAVQTQQLPSGFDYSEFTLEVSGSNTPDGYQVEMNIIDAFGNLNYMYAVGNPGDFDRGISHRYELEHARAAGFGMVVFDKDERTIEMECWRFLADVANLQPEYQFPGWPYSISRFDNSDISLKES